MDHSSVVLREILRVPSWLSLGYWLSTGYSNKK